MLKKKLVKQSVGNYDVRAERPYHTKPIIIETYFHQGVRMYEDGAGKSYVADVVDRIFNPQHKIPLKAKRYKGTNPNTKMASVL